MGKTKGWKSGGWFFLLFTVSMLCIGCFILNGIVYATLYITGSQTPFNLRFVSDRFEFVDSMESKKPGVGAKLNYELLPC